MNVELAYIRANNIEKVIAIARRRVTGELMDFGAEIDIKLPDSYDTILANDDKRKIALSHSINGWIAVIESKEVNDYAMLLQLSKELHTEVFAVVQADAVGAWGYVEMCDGRVIDDYYSEEDDEIEELLEEKMKQKQIRIPLYMFREVVREKDWKII